MNDEMTRDESLEAFKKSAKELAPIIVECMGDEKPAGSDKATPRPWKAIENSICMEDDTDYPYWIAHAAGTGCDPLSCANAELIVKAVNSLGEKPWNNPEAVEWMRDACEAERLSERNTIINIIADAIDYGSYDTGRCSLVSAEKLIGILKGRTLTEQRERGRVRWIN